MSCENSSTYCCGRNGAPTCSSEGKSRRLARSSTCDDRRIFRGRVPARRTPPARASAGSAFGSPRPLKGAAAMLVRPAPCPAAIWPGQAGSLCFKIWNGYRRLCACGLWHPCEQAPTGLSSAATSVAQGASPERPVRPSDGRSSVSPAIVPDGRSGSNCWQATNASSSLSVTSESAQVSAGARVYIDRQAGAQPRKGPERPTTHPDGRSSELPGIVPEGRSGPE